MANTDARLHLTTNDANIEAIRRNWIDASPFTDFDWDLLEALDVLKLISPLETWVKTTNLNMVPKYLKPVVLTRNRSFH